jgi:TonB family protein
MRGMTLAGLVAACLAIGAWEAAAQAGGQSVNSMDRRVLAPDLERRVFIDVNRVAPGEVLGRLANTVSCTLSVDKTLGSSPVSLRLWNVRARTALDAVCDTVGCRWTLKGTTLTVAATTPAPPVPEAQQWLEKLKTPLSGVQWKLDRVPLRDVLARLSQHLGAEVMFEGPDPASPVTEDLRGRSPIDALQRIPWAVGYDESAMGMSFGAEGGASQIRIEGRKGPRSTREQEASPAPPYKLGAAGLTMPTVISEARPAYTATALRAKIEGTVVLAAVVEKDGTVGDVKVLKALDPGLDEEATRAAKRWRFAPGTKDGKPVAVEVTLELTFTLRK